MLSCSSKKCQEEVSVEEAKDAKWLVRVYNGKEVAWCSAHRVPLPTWHDVLRRGEISDYL